MNPFSRSAFNSTDTELRLIAAAATIGQRSAEEVQDTRGDRYPHNVAAEGPEEILLDAADGLLAEPDGGGDVRAANIWLKFRHR